MKLEVETCGNYAIWRFVYLQHIWLFLELCHLVDYRRLQVYPTNEHVAKTHWIDTFTAENF